MMVDRRGESGCCGRCAEAPGASAAKAMETAAIKALDHHRWKLLFAGDARGRLTPTRG